MSDATTLLSAGYTRARTQYPGEGRRRWKLRAAREIWELDADSFVQTAASLRPEVTHIPWASDKDDFDLDDGPDAERIISLKGVIIRTDYSNDQAWSTFVTIMRDAEQEALEDSDTAMEDGDDSSEEDSESEEEEEEAKQDPGQSSKPSSPGSGTSNPPSVFHILDLPPKQRSHVSNASNIALLRLLTELNIVAAPRPAPPRGQYFVSPKTKDKHVSPMNPLIEKFGYKEVYEGRKIWVYDTLSNTDGCVRLVDGGVDGAYGSST
ncbi:hypothetical protein FRB96_006152 [Tulasnella sp. 330]|nr:hypothetical protein FRB96_006152 [Tulasnella sp. 330]KAG8874108.1 hypothetical protein FRB97_006122 [Tulasnella sp. 331]KAG8883791.1 hypothetical protein FRB98_002798 [Tulasnella sp. 332]